MITIRRTEPCSLSVAGHAGCTAFGSDPVCAAVSALVLTLGANVAGLAEEKLLESYEISLNSGNSRISCSPKLEIAPAAELIFDTVMQGLTLLAYLYPEHIVVDS